MARSPKLLLYAVLILSLAAGFPALAQTNPYFTPYAADPWSRNATARANPGDIVRAERMAEIFIAQRIDAERAKFARTAPPLAPDPRLADIARRRSDAMTHGAAFSHVDATGRFIAADMAQRVFRPLGTIGENIMQAFDSRGFDAAAFAATAVSGWMASPGHRANILSPDFNTSGIGVSVNGNSAVATQLFRGAW